MAKLKFMNVKLKTNKQKRQTTNKPKKKKPSTAAIVYQSGNVGFQSQILICPLLCQRLLLET